MDRVWVCVVIVSSLLAHADVPPAIEVIAVPDVPALVTTAPSRTVLERGRALNIEALTLHRAHKLDAAAAKYLDALRADPSNTIARYNLASLYVTKGEAKRALAVLAQFRVARCAFCMQRLRDAQTDKEWQSLWSDPTFKAIVAIAAPASPAPPAAGGGPPSPVINVQVEIAADADPSANMDPKPEDDPPAPDHVRVHIWTEVGPSFYPSPALDVVLRGAKGVVTRTSTPPASGTYRKVEVAIPSAGRYAVEVVQQGTVVHATKLVGRETRCLGGAHKLIVQTWGASSSLSSSNEPVGMPMMDDPQYDAHHDANATLTLVHDGVYAGDGAAVVEWRRNGKLVVTQQVALDRALDPAVLAQLDKATRADQLDAICPLALVHDDLKLPEEVRSEDPGSWDVRVYERDAQAYSAKFTWKKRLTDAALTVTPIATPKSVAFDKPADPQVAARAAEIRAMLRSREAVDAHLAVDAARIARQDVTAVQARVAALANAKGTAFTDAELPVPVVAAEIQSTVARPHLLHTPQLPAISPDGKTIAINQWVAFYMHDGQCAPPAANVPESYVVDPANAMIVASPDLSKFIPMACDVDKIAGLVVEHVGDDLMEVNLRDAKGAVLAHLKAEGGNGATACVAPKQHVLMLLMHWGAGGDCSSGGSYQPYFARY